MTVQVRFFWIFLDFSGYFWTSAAHEIYVEIAASSRLMVGIPRKDDTAVRRKRDCRAQTLSIGRPDILVRRIMDRQECLSYCFKLKMDCRSPRRIFDLRGNSFVMLGRRRRHQTVWYGDLTAHCEALHWGCLEIIFIWLFWKNYDIGFCKCNKCAHSSIG